MKDFGNISEICQFSPFLDPCERWGWNQIWMRQKVTKGKSWVTTFHQLKTVMQHVTCNISVVIVKHFHHRETVEIKSDEIEMGKYWITPERTWEGPESSGLFGPGPIVSKYTLSQWGGSNSTHGTYVQRSLAVWPEKLWSWQRLMPRLSEGAGVWKSQSHTKTCQESFPQLSFWVRVIISNNNQTKTKQNWFEKFNFKAKCLLSFEEVW